MKSVYAIRIFEVLQSKIMNRALTKEGIDINIPVQEIRECCGCEDKYPAFGNFKKKVIERAVRNCK